MPGFMPLCSFQGEVLIFIGLCSREAEGCRHAWMYSLFGEMLYLTSLILQEENGVKTCLDGSPYDEEQCSSPGGVQAMIDGELRVIPYKYPQPGMTEERGGARCGDDEVWCVRVFVRFPIAFACACLMDSQ